jgi:site-specific DNA-methyltransferase (adenine-specific)
VARAPGSVRDSIFSYLTALGNPASVAEIGKGVERQLGPVSPSSIRSYLNLNVPDVFERVGRGRYQLRESGRAYLTEIDDKPALAVDRAKLFKADCFEWLAAREPSSIHACVTDPPYGLVEYSEKELTKLHNGKGGVWRIPPSFDGHKRSPLPRFTVLGEEDRQQLRVFFKRLGLLLGRVLVPGANVVVASNPLLAHVVASAMSEGGLELRGTLIRLTMTMRGGDRPKNAHNEFPDISVMPRSMFEPWVVLRRPLEGRVQDNLRKWKTGGFRRISPEKPFGDVIRSSPTTKAERKIAPHPSLKPQDFLRRLVRAALPLGEGVIVDPFAGSGSTLAAANAVGLESIGVEVSDKYVGIARAALKKLSELRLVDPVRP